MKSTAWNVTKWAGKKYVYNPVAAALRGMFARRYPDAAKGKTVYGGKLQWTGGKHPKTGQGLGTPFVKTPGSVFSGPGATFVGRGSKPSIFSPISVTRVGGGLAASNWAFGGDGPQRSPQDASNTKTTPVPDHVRITNKIDKTPKPTTGKNYDSKGSYNYAQDMYRKASSGYHTYKKGSRAAKSFRATHAAATKASKAGGPKVFTWHVTGKKYKVG